MSLSQLSSRVWQCGKVVAESVPLETLNEELSDAKTLSWYDLTARTSTFWPMNSTWTSTLLRTLRPPVNAPRSPVTLTISSSRSTPRPLARPMTPTAA